MMDIVQRSEQNGNADGPQLVERLDSAIGEASTSIGMIMSELVRRSLRGGVGDIGTSIQAYAQERVASAVSEAMPGIHDSVLQLAESTTVRITDGVTERLNEELKGVEARTHENTQVIVARFKSEADAAIEVVSKAVGESRETADGAARDLQDLQQKARDSWKKVQADLQVLHEGRAQLESRLTDAQTLLEQSGQQIQQQQQHLAGMGQKLEASQRELLETRQQLAEQQSQLLETRQQLAAASRKLTEQTQLLTEKTEQLSLQARNATQKLKGLESTAGTMTGRLDELERPKGIRALFSKFGGKKKGNPAIEGPESEEIA